MAILYTVVGFIVYIIVGVIMWRSFNFFKMNLWRHASMTGFQYFCEKFVFAWIGPPLLVFFVWSIYFSETHKDVVSSSSSSITSSHSNKSSQTTQEQMRPAPSQESQKPDAQYDGDDPIVRARLGLPPKN